MLQVTNPSTAAGVASSQFKSRTVPAGFQDTLTQSSRIYTIPGKTANTSAPIPLATQKQSLLEQLDEYLREHPVARLRKAVMKAMGINEEDLQAMSPEDRQSAEEEISRRIQEKLKKPTKETAWI